MSQYILRRLALVLPVLVGVSIVVFSMVRLIPGDPARVMAGEAASEEVVEMIRQQLGLNEHPVVQYWIFLKNLFRGDLGRSTLSRLPVLDEITAALPGTLQLAVASMVIATALGVTTGLLSAVRPNSWVDALSMFIALVGVSMPVFWLGLMLMLLFSLHLGWFPTAGHGTWRHLVLPSITLGLSSAAIIARMTRSSMLEVLRQDYVRTARAKGVPERGVVLRHAFRNALIPVVTVMGLQFGNLLGGAVLTETVFAWPGIGRLMVGAITARDYPVVQGAVLTVAVGFILINLLVDVLYAYIDPTIRYD
ncbi:MAG: peptide ABC transporter permease [Firmicutes bacterium ZCTH02-B6]|nr:MAG: peptide ABC transporter permease [Firmicutes bacterium ZCTH02-B6]